MDQGIDDLLRVKVNVRVTHTKRMIDNMYNKNIYTYLEGKQYLE